MKKILIFGFLLFACLFISGDSNGPANAQITAKADNAESCGRLKSRFIVARNEMYSANSRHLEVFMDDAAFSEENLTQMFKYLSAQNADAKILVIKVKTNWQQFSFPDDCLNGSGASNVPEDPSLYDYHHATYHRSEFADVGKREYFKYNPELKVEKYKTVWIKPDSK